MNEVIDKSKCFGCETCVQICPEKCIDMKADATGYRYPYIDTEKCINCKLCILTCPTVAINKNTNTISPLSFVGIHKSDEILINSSSGGAFTAIVNSLDKECIIFGAAYNENLAVEHKYIDNIKDIGAFRKSKYVQSNIGDTFKQAKEFLLKGKTVIYTGTPCQIAGLRSYLKNDYENLLCIDLICTGIASPLLLSKSIEFIERLEKKKINGIDMRKKVKKNNQWIVINTAVQFEDGSSKSNEYTNMYKGCYGQSVGYRESCYNCSYAKLPRVSDITIGDWWSGMAPEVIEDKGTSLIMFNNQKWINIIDKINKTMILKKVDVEEAVKQNPTLWRPTHKPRRNDKFWKDFNRKPIEYVLKKYSVPPTHMRFIYAISKIFPKKIRNIIKSFIKDKLTSN